MSRRSGLSSRSKARRRAADTIYEAAIKGFAQSPADLTRLADKRRQVAVAQTGLPAYAYQIVCGVAEHIDAIDDAIATHSYSWSLDRMNPLDLAIMRVACWEILYNDDVDNPVAISEGVRVAREISAPKSLGFINAILDAVAREGYTGCDPRPDSQADPTAGNAAPASGEANGESSQNSSAAQGEEPTAESVDALAAQAARGSSSEPDADPESA